MKKEFKRKNVIFQLILILGLGVFASFIYGQLFITDDFLTQSLTYKFITTIILISIGIFLLGSFRDLYKKITINGTGITINNLLKKHEIKWTEVTEFRKQHKGIGAWAGYRYIIRYESYEVKELEIADNNIENVQELINSIFKFATNAKFIKIRNDSFLPFIKNYNISNWKND
jgi:hypothetical protein